MKNSAWEALFRHIPAEHQNKFMIVTASGVEIALQSFLRIEKELIILKGRLSGSQEQGRVFFIPYKHIDYFGTANVTKDAEFSEMFDSLMFPEAEEADPQMEMVDSQPYYPSQAMEPPPVQTRPPGYGSGVRPSIRSEVLERFRSSRTGTPSSSALPRPDQP